MEAILLKRLMYIAITLFLLLLLVPHAWAKVHYPPSPTIYYESPSATFWGNFLGTLLGNVLASNRAESQRKMEQKLAIERQKNAELQISIERQRLGKKLENTCKQLADDFAVRVAERGKNALTDVAERMGHIGLEKNFVQNGEVIILIGKDPATREELAFFYNPNYGKVLVAMTNPEAGVLAFMDSEIPYRSQHDLKQVIFEYLGLTVSPRIVSKNGHFGIIVVDVVGQGIAGSAGITPGDMITQIDTYPLKDRSVEQVTSYIANRIAQKSKTNIKIVRGDSVGYVSVQF